MTILLNLDLAGCGLVCVLLGIVLVHPPPVVVSQVELQGADGATNTERRMSERHNDTGAWITKVPGVTVVCLVMCSGSSRSLSCSPSAIPSFRHPLSAILAYFHLIPPH